jgi:hypothetical protein
MWLSKKGASIGPPVSGNKETQHKTTASKRCPPVVDDNRKRKQAAAQKAASNPRPPEVDEDRKRKQLAVLTAEVDATKKPSDVSPSPDVSVDEMNVTSPSENEITLLGSYQCADLVGQSFHVDHPGARSLQKGDKLTIEAEPWNEHDALAVRVFDENKKSCGYLAGESEIKPVLAALLLNPTTYSWLDRVEVTYIRPEYKYRGRVSMRFFGHVNNLLCLKGAMKGVQGFAPGNKK